MSKRKTLWAQRVFGFLFLILSIVVLCITLISLSPWKTWLAEQLASMLQQQGFENPHLTIETVTLNTINLRDITVGSESPLSLKNVEIHYSPEELWQGRLRDLTLSGLNVSIKQEKTGWQVRGISVNPENRRSREASLSIPMTQTEVNALPFDAFDVKKSHIIIEGNGWNTTAPFSATWTDSLSVHSSNINFKYDKTAISAAEVNIQAKLNETDNGWTNTWLAKDVSLSSLYVFDMKGTASLGSKGISIFGEAKAKDQSGIQGTFECSYIFSEPQKMLVKIKNLSMPWGDGSLSVKNVLIPVMGKKSLTFPVHAKKVSIDDLMRALTGEYVRATGTISGTLPVIIDRKGIFSIGTGALKADKKGNLSMPPDVIPGEGTQIEMTRDILKNFQYDNFTIDVKKEGKEKISVLLALKGKNPDMYNGREVHLNVRLGGDILDFIRSNVMMIMQPETMFKQAQ